MESRLNDEQRHAATLSEELERVRNEFAARPTVSDPALATQLEHSHTLCNELRSQVAFLERLLSASNAQNMLLAKSAAAQSNTRSRASVGSRSSRIPHIAY